MKLFNKTVFKNPARRKEGLTEKGGKNKRDWQEQSLKQNLVLELNQSQHITGKTGMWTVD